MIFIEGAEQCSALPQCQQLKENPMNFPQLTFAPLNRHCRVELKFSNSRRFRGVSSATDKDQLIPRCLIHQSIGEEFDPLNSSNSIHVKPFVYFAMYGFFSKNEKNHKYLKLNGNLMQEVLWEYFIINKCEGNSNFRGHFRKEKLQL